MLVLCFALVIFLVVTGTMSSICNKAGVQPVIDVCTDDSASPVSQAYLDTSLVVSECLCSITVVNSSQTPFVKASFVNGSSVSDLKFQFLFLRNRIVTLTNTGDDLQLYTKTPIPLLATRLSSTKNGNSAACINITASHPDIKVNITCKRPNTTKVETTVTTSAFSTIESTTSVTTTPTAATQLDVTSEVMKNTTATIQNVVLTTVGAQTATTIPIIVGVCGGAFLIAVFVIVMGVILIKRRRKPTNVDDDSDEEVENPMYNMGDVKPNEIKQDNIISTSGGYAQIENTEDEIHYAEPDDLFDT